MRNRELWVRDRLIGTSVNFLKAANVWTLHGGVETEKHPTGILSVLDDGVEWDSNDGSNYNSTLWCKLLPEMV